MSLVRLLSSGKSLVGMKQSESHYRMRRKNLLPKFGSPKNPFTTLTDSISNDEANPEADRSEPAAREMSAEETAAANLKETARLPLMAPVTSKARPPEETARRSPGRRGAWLRKLNPFAWWAGRRPAAEPPGSKAARTPVQGELSLDNVKVVRNDLSDADVEVVTAGTGVPVPKASEARDVDTPALLEPRAN